MVAILDWMMDVSFLSNTVYDWGVAALILVGSYVGLRILEKILLRKSKGYIPKGHKDIKDLIERIDACFNKFFYLYVSLYISLQYLVLDPSIASFVNYALMVMMVFYLVRAALTFVDFGTQKVIRRRPGGSDSIIRLMGIMIKALLWAIALITILSNMGIDVTSLVASLSIGGLAAALALQTIFHDLFAALSIYLDKPFEVGDFVIVGSQMGTIKKIGIRSTRLESLWGNEIVISNQDLTAARIDNYKRMQKRRIHFHFGVTYDTPSKKLRKIPGIVKEIFEGLKKVNLDRVHFKSFGDSSLDHEVAYYVNSADYAEYMDIQQDINLQLKERLEKEGISFAFPTRTVHLEK
ncbi:MAG: mechanosensitive ion channel family protein [Candidatus Woesearchaeota archaeon]